MRTSGGLGWNISENDCGVGLANLMLFAGLGVVKGLGSDNLTVFLPNLDLGVTLRARLRASSIEVPLLSVSKISLNVDLSILLPNPGSVLGRTTNQR